MFWKKQKKAKEQSDLVRKLLLILKGLRKNEANLSAKKTDQKKLQTTIKDDIARLTPYFYPKTLARMQNVLKEKKYEKINELEESLPDHSKKEIEKLLIESKLKNDQEFNKYGAFEKIYLQSMLYGQDLFSKMFLLEELNAKVMSSEKLPEFMSYIDEYTQEISEAASVDIIKHIFSDEAGTFKGYYGVKLNDLRRFVYRQTCQNKAYSFCLDYDYFLTLSADTFNPNNRKPIYLGFKLKDKSAFEKKVKKVKKVEENKVKKQNTKYKGVPNIEDAIKSDLIAEDIRQIFSESNSELNLEYIVLDKKMLIGLYKQALSQDLPPNIKTRLSKAIYRKYLGWDGADLSEVFDDITSYFNLRKNISSDDLDLLYLINPDECLNFIKQNPNPKIFKSNALKQHRLVRLSKKYDDFKIFFEKGSNLPACISSIHGDKNLYAFIRATKEEVNTQNLLQMITVILDNTNDKLEEASESKGDIDGALKDNALEAIFDEEGQLIDPIFLELVFKNDKLLNKYIKKNDLKAMESFKEQFPERYKAFSDKLVDNSASNANSAKHVPSVKFAPANPKASGTNPQSSENTTSSKLSPSTPGRQGR